jgi:hypothetical protein
VEHKPFIGGGIVFQSEELDNHLKKSHTISSETIVYAEWNLNDADNIERLGNYRYRPATTDNPFSVIPSTYDPIDPVSDTFPGYYTGATDADITIGSGFSDGDQPTLFTTTNEKMKLIYSLEDCLKPNRPRSGINKMLYLDTDSQYLNFGDQNPEKQDLIKISRRPRYYMSSRKDPFKYWTSFRTQKENGSQEEFGISRTPIGNLSYIYDAVPFVVYKEEVPTNKIVIKMQTNVGDVNLGPFRSGEEQFADPFFGYNNQTTPQRWKIQILKNDTWETAISFDENSRDENNNPIIKSDGYVEISYGLELSDNYKNFYVYAGELSNVSLLPEQAPFGYTYLVKSSDEDRGILYFYDGGTWVNITPNYSWFVTSETVDIRTPIVTKTSNPEYFIDESGETIFREFDLIKGIRIVVETMNKPEATFDLIEMSPRLFVDISEKVMSYSLTKVLSDLGNGSVPVGSIFASTGSMDVFDNDFSFNTNNVFDKETKTGSILSKYIDTRVKIIFYQNIRNVDNFDYFVPLKTMYTDEIPAVSNSTGTVSLTLRDFFFFLEASRAPELLITDVSISYAVSLLLDYVGYSNYVFKRVDGVPEIIIPFFFVGPDQNVAEVLRELALASQTAMFFDEYNNLVVMSKEYLLPDENQRPTDSYLFGQEEEENLPNIINLSSEEKKVYNEGNITYTTRYIQRAISEYKQAPLIDKYKTYGYRPSLLWEAAGKEQLRSQNELPQQSQGFTLSAVPLNTNISDEIPVVQNGEIINNIIDLGEGVDNVSSYSGYLYANGEIIKYDAMEYSVNVAIWYPINNDGSLDESRPQIVLPGRRAPENISSENINEWRASHRLGSSNIWIKSNQEYQRFFSKLPFNGKMYPTGNIRIFVEPEYETVDGLFRLKNGNVKKHGRGQFGTPVVSHDAGLNPYWSDNANVRGSFQEAEQYLFNTSRIIEYPDTSVGVAGKVIQSPFLNADVESRKSSRNGIIKNFRANKYYTENEINYFSTARAGTLQSSALVFNGAEISEQIKPINFLSYVYKDLPQPYKHFGTRMRIIGKVETESNNKQTPYGGFSFFETQNLNIDDPEKNVQILGGSGGLAFGLNKETNNGYYFEIVSLTQDNVSQYVSRNKEEIKRYKILKEPVVSVVDNVVTVRTEEQVPYEVGQTVIINGLVDKNSDQNTKTPLNGEYRISAMAADKKSFQYTIPKPNNLSLSITSAEGDGTAIKYNVPIGDTRLNQIKEGDLVNISGTSISDFNIQNAAIRFFIKQNTGWYFIVESSASGSATGGTATYISLNTESKTGGTVSVSEIGNNEISNVYFYKVVKDKDGKAIPIKLWSGISSILVDDGRFTGQYRFVGEENPTVYDLSAEYVDIGNTRRFYLYINNNQVATVTDPDPLPKYNNMALFVRGTSRCMFENIYAIGANVSQNSKIPVAEPISKVFGDDEIDANEALRKYALSGVIQKTYLSGIGSEEPPSHILYFDEFGTIMREAAYLNIKYDRAFPALYARIMKTFNRIKGYAISGFYAGSYAADFLVFNCLDTNINLDDTTGNYLRIQGITFTQNTTKTLSTNDYYNKLSNLSDPIGSEDGTLISPFIVKDEYNRIVNSRTKYGTNEFSIETPYIQTDEAAEEIFGWTMDKVSKPKILVGLNTFGTFNLQLGDIVQVNYKNNESLDIISSPDKRFVIYNIEYSKSESEQTITTYLAEV